MNRRTLLAALGAVGAGGAVVTGTGAFTSVEAERDLTVNVANDAAALLALEPNGPNGDYTETNNGTLGIDISGGNDNLGEDPSGVNKNAVTLIEDLFRVRNQGTQEVEVSITPLTFVQTSGFGALLVLLVPTSGFPTVTISPGDGGETYSLVIASVASPFGNLGFDSTITINAEAT